ncbi:MAG: ABC transporter ATP-binding protein [Spirochaetales bacterium]|nr:ABC transporter ATP-binding protein [Spirochaetales bacterium]
MIQVKDVERTYVAGDTKVHALKGVSLSVKEGEFLSIAGPSGSGKTTLLNIIGCIDDADKGDVIIDQVDVRSKKPDELAVFRREKLGFVFQTFNLIPVMSAYENVEMVLKLLKISDAEARERTMAILKEVGLEGMEDRRPSRLSGGQQQRVAIARALVKNPTLVLADEPTANLDSVTGKAVLDIMKAMNKKYGTAFIFSTHDKMVMDFAERLVMLHDGKIESDKRR